MAVICSKDKYFDIVTAAMDNPFNVDVIDMEEADDRIISSIERDGVILYEKWKITDIKGRTSIRYEGLGRPWREVQSYQKEIEFLKPDEFDYIALAYTIVNLYNLMENYFSRIAKCFENNVDKLIWHKDLLRRMTLDVHPFLIHLKPFWLMSCGHSGMYSDTSIRVNLISKSLNF